MACKCGRTRRLDSTFDDWDRRLTGMGVDVVATYRCFLVRGELIRSVQIFECADDAEVKLKATAFLGANPGHQSIEVWQAGRFVVRIPGRAEDRKQGGAD